MEKSCLENIAKRILKNNLSYDEWKEIKEIAEKLVLDIDAKMKETASIALAEKAEHLAKLQAEIEELKDRITQLEARLAS